MPFVTDSTDSARRIKLPRWSAVTAGSAGPASVRKGNAMVLVQFRVRVPDVERFARAARELMPQAEEDGARNQGLYGAESDPGEMGMLAEWESHDAMMVSSDKRGDAFQAAAGTEGLDWETRIWHHLAGAAERIATDGPAVLVQFQVTVPDVERFRKAFETGEPLMESDGGRRGALYTAESNPSEIGWFTEWDSHDAMMESSEKRGEEFQAAAGTEGLDWETRIWHRLA